MRRSIALRCSERSPTCVLGFLLHDVLASEMVVVTSLQAEREVQTYKVQIEAGALARQSHEMQIELLQQENGALERNVIALRRVVAERHGLSDDCCSHSATASSSSSRDLALIAHLEARAKDSEQRAESMMFQRNEAQSRCGSHLHCVYFPFISLLCTQVPIG